MCNYNELQYGKVECSSTLHIHQQDEILSTSIDTSINLKLNNILNILKE